MIEEIDTTFFLPGFEEQIRHKINELIRAVNDLTSAPKPFDPNVRLGPSPETPEKVAARHRRLDAFIKKIVGSMALDQPYGTI